MGRGSFLLPRNSYRRDGSSDPLQPIYLEEMMAVVLLKSVKEVQEFEQLEEEKRAQVIEDLLKATQTRWEADSSLSACCCSEDRGMVNA